MGAEVGLAVGVAVADRLFRPLAFVLADLVAVVLVVVVEGRGFVALSFLGGAGDSGGGAPLRLERACFGGDGALSRFSASVFGSSVSSVRDSNLRFFALGEEADGRALVFLAGAGAIFVMEDREGVGMVGLDSESSSSSSSSSFLYFGLIFLARPLLLTLGSISGKTFSAALALVTDAAFALLSPLELALVFRLVEEAARLLPLLEPFLSELFESALDFSSLRSSKKSSGTVAGIPGLGALTLRRSDFDCVEIEAGAPRVGFLVGSTVLVTVLFVTTLVAVLEGLG